MASEIDIINIRHIESIQNISRKLRNESEYKYSEAAIQSCPYEKVSENMQQIYRRTPMPKCNFNRVTKQPY